MRFSILIPVYNVEKYIGELFESLDAQTFKDFQVVMVDDGSSDSSPAICDEYCRRNPMAQVYHKANAGRLRARLDALSQAQGDYVLFVDSDDLLKASALQDISDIIDRYSSDIVIYNADTFAGEERGVFFEHELPEGVVADKQLIYDKLLMSYSMNSMCLKAVKRSLFDMSIDYSDFYDCTVAEDLLQSVPLFIAAQNIYYLDRSLYEYRVTSGSTHRYNPNYYWFNRRVSHEIRKRLANQGIRDLNIKAAFHLLVAAYAGTTQIKYCDRFDKSELERIRSDSEFAWAWDQVWNSSYAESFNKKQKLILKLLHDGHYGMINTLLKLRGGN